MTRSTMTNLISRVRAMTGASSAEYTIGATPYWTDDQIQDLLDWHRHDSYTETLTPIPEPTGGGSMAWRVYRSLRGDYEETNGGTALFVVRDSSGAIQGTANWSADYLRGIVTFASNTGGSSYLLSGRSYDLFAAAADLLEHWAARMAVEFDFASDKQDFQRSQKHSALLRLAQQYRQHQYPRSVSMYRNDLR